METNSQVRWNADMRAGTALLCKETRRESYLRKDAKRKKFAERSENFR